MKKLFEEQRMNSLKVDQLKVIVKYLRDNKRFNVSPARRKQQLVDAIYDTAYNKADKRIATAPFPTSPQNAFSGTQPNPTSPGKVYMPYTPTYTPPRVTIQQKTTIGQGLFGQYPFPQQPVQPQPPIAHSRYNSLPTDRTRTKDEIKFFTLIDKERTMGGLIDCFSDPEELIDIRCINSSTRTSTAGKWQFQFNLKQSTFNLLMSSQDYQLQIHFFSDQLKPKNWGNDTTIYVNGGRAELPKLNRKLAKKMAKEVLITSSPAIVNKSIIRKSGWIDIIINSPTYTGALEGLCVMFLCRQQKLEELVEIVKARSPKLEVKSEVGQEQQEHHLDIDGDNTMRPQHNQVISPIVPFKQPIAPVKKQEYDDDDDDIQIHDVQVVSLKDPVSMDRIELPAKGTTCVHRTVFDLATYLEFGKSSHAWNCPCCDKPLPFGNLVLDPTLDKIIHEVDPNAEKIVLHTDGSYEIYVQATNNTPKAAIARPVETNTSMQMNGNNMYDETRTNITPPLLDLIDDFDDPRPNTPPLYAYSDIIPGLDYTFGLGAVSPGNNSSVNTSRGGSTIEEAIEIDD
jgi:NACalpha-BTF3-like transcription factor